MASALPVRDAVMSAVSPPGLAELASAPAFKRLSIIAALPFTAARYRGCDTVSSRGIYFRAGAKQQLDGVPRSSARTAQCKAVIPSGWVALTSIFC